MQGPVSIQRPSFPDMESSIIKIRQSWNRLIFIMGISVLVRWAPRLHTISIFKTNVFLNPPNATKIYFAAYVSFLRDFSSSIYILKASYHNFWKTNSHYRCLNIEYNTAFTRRPSKWQDRKKSKYKYRTTLTNNFSLLVQAAGCITPLNHFQNFCLVFHATVGIVDPKYDISNHSIGSHTCR